jgi:signal transduction histidine kinase
VSIRKSVIFIISLTLIGFLAILYITLRSDLTQRFEQAEIRDMTQTINILRSLINDKMDDLPPPGNTGSNYQVIILGDYLNELSRLLNCEINIFLLNDKNLPPEIQDAVKHLDGETTTYVSLVNEQTIIGYFTAGNTALSTEAVFQAKKFRVLYQNNLVANRYMMLSVIILTTLIGIMMIILIDTLVVRRLSRLSNEVILISETGNLEKRVRVDQHDEITRLSKVINSMLDTLDYAHKRLQALSRQLVNLQEVEKRQIALELHDEIGQTLTSLGLLLRIDEMMDIVLLKDRLARSKELVGELINRVRKISLDLRPPMLDDLGMIPSLEWLFESYTKSTRIKVIFRHNNINGRRFKPEIEIGIFRIIQEALTNVARHAKVDRVDVRLWMQKEIICFQIEDEGAGFDTETQMINLSSSGLEGIRERVNSLGGSTQITSSPGAGTSVSIEIPMDYNLFRDSHANFGASG